MTGAMSVVLFISFISVAVVKGTAEGNSTTPLRTTTDQSNTSVTTTMAHSSLASTTITSDTKGPNTNSTKTTVVPVNLFSSELTTEAPQTQSATPAQVSSSTLTIEPSQTQSATSAHVSFSNMTTEASQPQSATPVYVSSGETSGQTTNNHTLTGTPPDESRTSNLTSILSAQSDLTSGTTSASTVIQIDGKPDMNRSPGLVAVLCIFFLCLILLLVFGITKLLKMRDSKFQRLEEVPMGTMNEGSPFAQYPIKQY
ncbi:hypothetical protein DPEC_G00271200 [Dallia pectoralis]|uniref:Uncharacterized protein n=1 Tax=Dallia pectoralis TaxID=75939 RepID=A0ACC2FQ12_DALPE|nr:hypothetical protein DPEC_G00271200 [Dallia pectoralis]